MRSFAPLFVGALGLFACTTEQVLVLDPVAAIEASAPYPAMSPGEVHQFTAALLDEFGEPVSTRGLVWRSLDTAAATVDGLGQVTARAVGLARIEVTEDDGADTVEVPVVSSWSAVSVAEDRLTCAARIGGNMWCWGRTVGDGTRNYYLAPVELAGRPVLRDIQSFFYGDCGLDATDHLYCWTRIQGGSSEFGNGPALDSSIVPVLAATGKTFTSFGRDYQQTCGAGTDGRGWCWGSQIYYGVSTTSVVSRSTPDSVRGGLSWRILKSGAFASCGLLTSGAAYCFGGSTSTLPSGMLGLGAGGTIAKTPTPVVGGLTFDSLWVSGRDACALTSAGALYCWGGQDPAVPARVDLPPIRAASVASGHICALGVSGQLYCWASSYASPLPTSPVEPLPTTLRFVAIDVAPDRACGLTGGGGLYCWGDRLVGDGRREPSAVPVRVTDPE
jgi:hypothetical protein